LLWDCGIGSSCPYDLVPILRALADRHFEHFNPSHSRLQTNTALKFAPEIGSLVGAIWMKNWRFGGYPEPIFHSVFIQFFVAGLEGFEKK